MWGYYYKPPKAQKLLDCNVTMPQQPPFLMIPGPTPLPDAVREALGRPAIGIISPEFKKVLESVLPALQWIFQTKNDVLLYTASGTGAMEAALVTTLNPGDKVLCLTCGVFRPRFAEIATTLGLDVEKMTVPMGEHNPVDVLKTRLAQDAKKEIKAVTIIHSETSTGVLNPVKDLISEVRQHGALSIVDTVTSIGAAEFKFDDWGADVAVSGSQKGFMLPPGLSFLALSDRAWQAHQNVKNPGYYFNFSKYKKSQAEFTTPYTPSTPLIIALDVALKMMQAEGLENVLARHAKLQSLTRKGVSDLGLELFVKNDLYASTAATAVLPPDGLSVDEIRGRMKKDFGFLIANGQKELVGKIFRIGHLGHINEQNVSDVLAALKTILSESKVNA